MTQVAIVGGGLAGLAVAEALLGRATAAPFEVTVYERQPRAGGLARTDRVDGYLCESGPNGFLDNAPATLALVARLGLTSRLVASHDAARRRYIYRAGRLRRLPASPLGLLTSGVLSPAGVLRLFGEPFVARGADAVDESIHAFAQRRFGRQAADVLADAMVSGVFAGDSRQLSLHDCFPAVARMEREHGSLVRALVSRLWSAGTSERRGIGRLTSFPEGIGELIDAVAVRVGPRLRTSAAVQRVQRTNQGYRLTLSGGEATYADAVVLTCELDVVRRLCEADPALASFLPVTPMAPVVTLCLGYPNASVSRPLDGFGFLVPRGSRVRLLGALWESSVFPNRAPTDRVLIRVIAGGATDPGAVDLDDERLLALVRAELRSTMRLDAEPVFTRIVRVRPGLPQYVRGHGASVARIDQALDGRPGLYIGGHGLRGVGINALVEDASRLADRLLAWMESRPGRLTPAPAAD